MGEPRGTAATGAAAGDRVGSFDVVDVLGAGGMGTVLRARHATTGRLAALKLVRLPDHRLVASIRREIHALEQLDHPGIVKVLESGLHGGMPWYAMELVSGMPLRRSAAASSASPDEPTAYRAPPADGAELGAVRVAGAPPPLASRSELEVVLAQVRSLCEPLGYMHGEGLVHRDLKPDNIMVRADGSAVVIDFGLTTRFGGPVSRDVLDVGGLVVGTIPYMSPEQARGDLVDARSDLYALGCILYELLTGRPPFLGLPSQVLQAHASLAPEPPSRHASVVPSELDELVLSLLAKSPRARLGYADDVARGLGRLCRAPARPEPPPGSRSYLYRPGFAGRAKEVERLVGAIRALRRRGAASGGVFLVGGQSGIGKTRLVTEILTVANVSGLPILTGQARPEGSEPLELLRGALVGIADRCRDGRADEAAVIGARGPLLARYVPALAALPGQADRPPPVELVGREARLRLHAALRETLCAFAEPDGLVLALDDLQWADELSLELLQELAPVAARSRTVVLATYRSDEVHPPLRALLDGARVERLDLGNLDLDAVQGIVRDMLAMASPPPRFSRFLWSQSEGSPFFVAEYLRAAVAHGILWRDGGGAWRVAQEGDGFADYGALGLPRSLHELVQRRLAGIEGAPGRLLDAATVLGREMPAALLLEVAGIEGAEGLHGAHVLMARQILEESGGDVRFVHDKIREVRLASLAPAQLRSLHHAAAERLTALAARDGAPRHAERAHHWEQCGEDALARPCHLAAARAATEGAAHDEAERHYRSYLRLAGPPTAESVVARTELGILLGYRGRMPDAEAVRLKALEEARVLGDAELEVRLMNALGRQWLRSGSPARAREIFNAALALATAGEDLGGEATTLGNLALHAEEYGELEVARRCFERQLAMHAAAGQLVREGETASALANILQRQGLQAQAEGLYGRALEIARRTNDRINEGVVLGALGRLLAARGRIAESVVATAREVQVLRETGRRRMEATALVNLSVQLSEQGRVEESIEVGESALRLAREVHDRRIQGIVLANLGSLRARLGRWRLAGELNEQALAIHRELGNRGEESSVLGNLAEIDQHEGELDLALSRFEAAAASARELGNREVELLWQLALAEILGLMGELARADERARAAEAILAEKPGDLHLGSLACVRGHLALARGTSAAGEIARAREIHEEGGSLPTTQLASRLQRLVRAQSAFADGAPLVSGFALEDISPGQRRWLRERRPGALPDDAPGEA